VVTNRTSTRSNGQQQPPQTEGAAALTGRMGLPAEDTHPALQTDAFKELINKLAWVLGSTYRAPYSRHRTLARDYAVKLAQVTVRDHGYPNKIGKEDQEPSN